MPFIQGNFSIRQTLGISRNFPLIFLCDTKTNYTEGSTTGKFVSVPRLGQILVSSKLSGNKIMSSKILIDTPVKLYKHLLKTIRKLPATTQDYYKNHVRQNFNSHCDETDQERINQIISRALDDADWVLKKYVQKT